MPKRVLSVLKLPHGWRLLVALVAYAAILSASLYLAYEIRFDFAVPADVKADQSRWFGYVILGKLLMLGLFRQIGSVLRYFSIPDLARVGASMALATMLMLASRWVSGETYIVPRGVMVVDLVLSIAGLCAFRLSLRILQERLLLARRFPSKKLERIAIIGAGDTGASLANDLLNMPARGLKPVAFFDDDRRKKGTLVHGVDVVGPPEDLVHSKFAEVTTAVIAMPSAPQKRVREIALFLAKEGYKVEIVPALEDLASGKAKVSRIRPVEVEDLLGREEVELDTTAIRKFVENKSVMVTGAGGSIGSELCRQIARFNPRRLVLVDQSEPALFQIEQELNAEGFSGTALACVADVLDLARMNSLFGIHAPQVVFHAAAHKHVFMMERQPSEAIKNNAVGTRKIAELAIAHHAEAFVLISTDKAINPTNVMGASKRLAELHLQALHAGLVTGGSVKADGGPLPAVSGRAGTRQGKVEDSENLKNAVATRTALAASTASTRSNQAQGGTKLMAVRFGNVLGSSGSVVPIFKKQIEAGGPVTVTHPDVTRYFMTIPEAVGLVLQASVLGKGGEIFVLDMGQPMKIVDLAKQMIELSGFKVGEDIEIKFSGLKPGEKLFEELQHHSEQHAPTEHPRIMRFVNDGAPTETSRMAIAELEPFVDELSPADLKRQLKVLIPEYQPCLE